jgi:ATP-binding cassette subfamily C protein
MTSAKSPKVVPTLNNSLKLALRYMTKRERARFFLLVALRALASLLDLLGVVALGLVATTLASMVTMASTGAPTTSIAGVTFSANNPQELALTLVAILALFVVKAVTSYFLTGSIALIVATVEARASVSVATIVLGGGLEDARSHSREELFFASFAGTSAAFSAQLNALATLISEGFLFACLTITFFVVDAASTVIVAIYFAVVALLIQLAVGKRLQKAATSVRELHLAQDQTLNDLFSSFRELTVANRRSHYFERISQLRHSAASDVAVQLKLGTLPRHLIETSLILGVLALGSYKFATGNLADSALMLGVFLTGSLRMMAAMLPWQAALISLRQSLPAAQKALDLLKADSGAGSVAEIRITPSQQKVRAGASLAFDNVSFSYRDGDRLALKGLSFSVENGQQLAIIGRSGSGKSTIADLICGILEPSSGCINYGETSELPKIAYVPQRPSAISGTILDNITLGASAEPIDDIRLENAISAANLSEYVSQLPEGLETDMGKHMDSLSGGQLQRLGIARALYQEPDILVLDEATSSLDSTAEYEVGQTLERLRGKVTVVVIAHKLVTVQHSDKVLFMESGHLLDQGTFDQVAKRNPSVAKAVELSSIQ